jgi:hypothetical protein
MNQGARSGYWNLNILPDKGSEAKRSGTDMWPTTFDIRHGGRSTKKCIDKPDQAKKMEVAFFFFGFIAATAHPSELRVNTSMMMASECGNGQ